LPNYSTPGTQDSPIKAISTAVQTALKKAMKKATPPFEAHSSRAKKAKKSH
jgi:hypothetical protein